VENGLSVIAGDDGRTDESGVLRVLRERERVEDEVDEDDGGVTRGRLGALGV